MVVKYIEQIERKLIVKIQLNMDGRLFIDFFSENGIKSITTDMIGLCTLVGCFERFKKECEKDAYRDLCR
jgi:hypothetical protein